MTCESCYCKTCQYFKICEPCKNDYDNNKYSCNGECDEYCKKKCSELKGNEYEPDDWDSLANAERDH